MKDRLIFRVDASTQVGTGHLMRCLALAQAWKDAGGKVAFITGCQSETLLQQLREEGFDIHLLARLYPDADDWEYIKNILADYPSAWVVLDGYHFDEVYQQRVKELGHRLLVVDDMAHLKHYYADIILNHNLHAEQLQYSCEPYTCLLLGTRYVLLRREFFDWKSWKREIPEVARHILVTLGGGDPDNLTLKVIQALQEVKAPDLEVTVVIGASNPHSGELETAVKQSRVPIQLVRDVRNMPELMSWADVAISAAGVTSLETAYMSLPNIVIVTGDNQAGLAKALHDRKLSINLGQYGSLSWAKLIQKISNLLKDRKLRGVISRVGRQLIDGQGTQRVVDMLAKSWEPVIYG